MSFTELRNNAKAFFDAVENGETIEVLRRGRVVAQIRPVRQGPNPRWLNRPKPLRLAGGAALSDAIIKERRGSKR